MAALLVHAVGRLRVFTRDDRRRSRRRSEQTIYNGWRHLGAIEATDIRRRRGLAENAERRSLPNAMGDRHAQGRAVGESGERTREARSGRFGMGTPRHILWHF